MSAPGLPATAGWLALLFAVSLAGTVVARRYALRRDLLDHPGERRSHQVATPRGGGIGIVLAMFAAMALLAWRMPDQAATMALAALGLALVSGIGWIDDHRPLSPWLRLAVHAIAGGLLGAATLRAGGGPWLALAAFALSVALVNIWNFMDGIDGIAGLQAVVVAVAFALLAPDPGSRWIALALAAATLGFLPMNLPRARIFLGDVGSGALGYVLALAMVMLAGQKGASPATWALLLLPPSAFLLDAALTLSTRMVRGERWWTAHVGHAYQRWARSAGRHLPVAFAYAAWAAGGSWLAWRVHDSAPTFIMCVAVAWYLGGGIAWLRFQSRQGRPGKQNG